ncbi:phosphotransferase [bacterium]|nr:phosphotransferase [bacterium]
MGLSDSALRRHLRAAFGEKGDAYVSADAHAGTTTRSRWQLNGHGGPADLPSSVFVKSPAQDMASRIMGVAFGLGRREVIFYRQLSAEVPVRVPKMYAAHLGRRPGTFSLVIEDLAEGTEFPNLVDGCSDDVATAVIDAQAKFHGRYWGSDRFAGDLESLAIGHWLKRMWLRDLLLKASLKKCFELHPGVVPAEQQNAAKDFLKRTKVLDRHTQGQAPFTLIHGDCHAGNLFVQGPTVGFLDWQLARQANGLYDMSYFMFSSMPIDRRRALEADLIERYRRGLSEAGVEAPTTEAANAMHALNALHVWMSAVVTGGMANLQTMDATRGALERAVAAVDDHDSFARLAALS